MLTYSGLRAAERANPVLAAAFAQLTGYTGAVTVRDDAVRRLHDLTAASPTVTEPSPLDSGELTDKWVDQAIAAESYRVTTDAACRVLATVKAEAEADAVSIVDIEADTVFTYLHAELQTILEPARTLDLKGATTAAAAITAGVEADWRALTQIRADYDEVRRAQARMLSQYPETATNAIGGNTGVDHCNRAWIRNIESLWPAWRQPHASIDIGRENLPPWPTDDPTAELAWLLEHDAVLWVPTPGQLAPAPKPDHRDMPSLLVQDTTYLNEPGAVTFEPFPTVPTGTRPA